MADPFRSLAAPLTPADPDPAFAADLRERLQRALSLPRGVAVSTATASTTEPSTTEPSTTEPSTGARAAEHRVTPYLAVRDARRALDWYAEALGARQRGEPVVMPDGRIGHAEIEIEGGPVMLSDAHPEIGVVAPEPGEGATVTLHAEVADVDALTSRAVAAGATLERAPSDNPYGRIAVIRDPFGHRWMLNTRPRHETARQGDLTYVSLWVPDGRRAAAFYGEVLGWRYRDGEHPMVDGAVPAHGIYPTREASTLFLCFGVDDLDAAVARVREAGGTASEPVEEPYGRIADCVDDQGLRFALHQLTGNAPRPVADGRGSHGDLVYVTVLVPDSQRARAFYGAVLGWAFTPGRVADGWGVVGAAPMTGLSGGHEQPAVVPMYRVDDIDAAVARVRAGGGTSTDPQRQPYGVTAECTDDQGTRFYLGGTA